MYTSYKNMSGQQLECLLTVLYELTYTRKPKKETNF